MSEMTVQELGGVAETSLIALYIRALESQRPDALIRDEKAVALVARMGSDLDRVKRFPMSDFNLAATKARTISERRAKCPHILSAT